jgi:exosome complex component RRP4
MGRQLSIGDLIIARIVSFDRTRDPMLTVQDKDLGKIPYGEFIKISPTRVPRLIGKRGSMIQTIEQATQTRVIIGQNGIVVVTGRDPDGLSLAAKAIKLVEEESHTTNLTQRVKTLLNVQDPEDPEQPESMNVSSSTESPTESPKQPQSSTESPTPNNSKSGSTSKEKHRHDNSEKSSNNDSNDDQKEKKR